MNSIINNKNYQNEIEKYCEKNMKNNKEIIKKLLPYIYEIMKDLVIAYVTK